MVPKQSASQSNGSAPVRPGVSFWYNSSTAPMAKRQSTVIQRACVPDLIPRSGRSAAANKNAPMKKKPAWATLSFTVRGISGKSGGLIEESVKSVAHQTRKSTNARALGKGMRIRRCILQQISLLDAYGQRRCRFPPFCIGSLEFAKISQDDIGKFLFILLAHHGTAP